MANRLSRLRKLPLLLAILVAIPLGSGSLACQSKPEPISIGLLPSAPAYAPVYIAPSEGFFAGNGLDVTIKDALKTIKPGAVNIISLIAT